jgi:membrane protein DedA with SNARE-associated domain
MEHISISTLKHFIEIHAIIIYFIIILGVILEGEIVVIFAGIFSYLGPIHFFIALIAVILGGVIKSFLGYTIGSSLQKHHSHNNIIKKVEMRLSSFLPHFNEKPFWSIFISRFFVFGVGWFTLVFSGFKKVPIKIYAKAEALSLMIWSVLFLALGFSFGYTALSISRDVRNFIGIILLFFLMFFILEKILAFIIELFAIQRIDR